MALNSYEGCSKYCEGLLLPNKSDLANRTLVGFLSNSLPFPDQNATVNIYYWFKKPEDVTSALDKNSVSNCTVVVSTSGGEIRMEDHRCGKRAHCVCHRPNSDISKGRLTQNEKKSCYLLSWCCPCLWIMIPIIVTMIILIVVVIICVIIVVVVIYTTATIIIHMLYNKIM